MCRLVWTGISTHMVYVQVDKAVKAS